MTLSCDFSPIHVPLCVLPCPVILFPVLMVNTRNYRYASGFPLHYQHFSSSLTLAVLRVGNVDLRGVVVVIFGLRLFRFEPLPHPSQVALFFPASSFVIFSKIDNACVIFPHFPLKSLSTTCFLVEAS
jgi:hypothetical protein